MAQGQLWTLPEQVREARVPGCRDPRASHLCYGHLFLLHETQATARLPGKGQSSVLQGG